LLCEGHVNSFPGRVRDLQGESVRGLADIVRVLTPNQASCCRREESESRGRELLRIFDNCAEHQRELFQVEQTFRDEINECFEDRLLFAGVSVVPARNEGVDEAVAHFRVDGQPDHLRIQRDVAKKRN
jgi:hypothetical protein